MPPLFSKDRMKELHTKIARGEPILVAKTQRQTPPAIEKPFSLGKQERLYIELLGAVDDDDLEAVKKCLEQGADINARDTEGNTLLIEAIAKKRTAIAEFLVNRGADVNARNNEGSSVLDFASAPQRTEIAELVRKAGAR